MRLEDFGPPMRSGARSADDWRDPSEVASIADEAANGAPYAGEHRSTDMVDDRRIARVAVEVAEKVGG